MKILYLLLLVSLVGCNSNTSEKIYLSCDGNAEIKKLISQFPTVYETDKEIRKFTLKIEILRRQDLYRKTNRVDPITTVESKNSKAFTATFTGNAELYSKFEEYGTENGFVTINHNVDGNEQSLKIYKSETTYDKDDLKKANKKIAIYNFVLDRISGDFSEKEETYIDYSVLPNTVDVKGNCKKVDKVF